MILVNKYRLAILFSIVIGIALVQAVAALDVKEIMTRLTTGDVAIKSDDRGETITFSSSVDFSHKGRNMKGDSGVIVLRRKSDEQDYREPVLLKLNGRIEYNDKDGFSGGSRGGGDFDFMKDEADLRDSAWIRAQDLSLQANVLNYQVADKIFRARGNIHHKGMTESLHFDRDTSSVADRDTGITGEYNLRCDSIIYEHIKGSITARGSIRLNFENAGFESESVDIHLDDSGIKSIFATGNVVFRNPYMEGMAHEAMYVKETEQLTFGSASKEEKISFTYKGQKLEGVQIVVNMADDDEKVEILDSTISIHPDFES